MTYSELVDAAQAALNAEEGRVVFDSERCGKTLAGLRRCMYGAGYDITPGETDSLTARAFADRMAYQICNPPFFLGLLNQGPPAPVRPLTRWEKIRNRLADYRERVVTAWRVLRGDDIHEDCDW